jgi:Cyclic nucleotide-binding domain/FHA domain
MAKETATARNLDDVAAFTVSGSAGDVIFREGETSAEMYVILDGAIELERQVGAESRIVGRLDPGDFFGETSLLADGPREVTAKATTDYRILKLDRDTVGQLVREEPEIAMRLLRRLSERLRERLEAEARAAEIAMAPLKRSAGPRPATIAMARPELPAGPAVLAHESGREFPLADGPEWIVGRVDRGTGTRPPVDLTELDTDRLLSRQHAIVVRRETGYFVREEKASRNGTFVNGARLEPKVEHPLLDGDEVRFASVAMQFRHR